MNRFGEQQRYDGGSTERGDDTNRQEHGARHETGESVGWIRYPLPSLSPEPNREKTLSVRKHPISQTDHIISHLSQHGYRICTRMFETLFAEHPSLASMFRKEDHTVQPGESYERQPLLVAQAVRHSPRFLFLALTRFSSFSSFSFQVHAYAFHIDNLTALEPAIQR